MFAPQTGTVSLINRGVQRVGNLEMNNPARGWKL